MTILSSTLWLRIASVLTLVFAAGHAMGAADSWSPAGETDVLRAMRTFEFEVMGIRRTYWHFYYGFGIYITILLAVLGVLMWQLASITHVTLASMIGSLAVASALGTGVLWRYIFPVPALFSLLIAASLSLAFVAALTHEAARSRGREGSTDRRR